MKLHCPSVSWYKEEYLFYLSIHCLWGMKHCSYTADGSFDMSMWNICMFNMLIKKYVVPLYQCTFGTHIRNRPASVLYYNTQGFWWVVFTWGLASIHLLDLSQKAGCKIIPIWTYSMEYALVEKLCSALC